MIKVGLLEFKIELENPYYPYPNPQANVGPNAPVMYPSTVPADIIRNNQMKSFDGVSDKDGGHGMLDNFSKLRGDEERQGFVVKVFGIMTVQVAITTLFTWFIISSESRMKWC